MQPVLSIVIPTRNRTQYAEGALRGLLRIPAEDVEFVVQDSSDSPALGRLAERMGDARIRYRYSPPPLNMVENFNLAVEAATGEYVCLLGDDDGVNPEIVAATRWARAEGIDALAPRNIAAYYWPDFRSRFKGDQHAGKLYVRPFDGTCIFPDMGAAMRRSARGAGQGVEVFHLPRVYEGIIRRGCLDRAREKTGAYFGGVSPDVYAALAVAGEVKRCCEIDYPLVIAGSGGQSASGSGAMRKHKGELRQALRSFKNLEWPDAIPAFYSVETVWAQSSFIALQRLGRRDLIEGFNLPLLYAQCAAAHPDYLGSTLHSFSHHLRTTKRGRLRGLAAFLTGLAAAPARRLRYLLPRLLPAQAGAACYSHLPGIAAAVESLESHLKATHSAPAAGWRIEARACRAGVSQ